MDTSSRIASAREKCKSAEQEILTRLNDTTLSSDERLLDKKLVNVRILAHLLSTGPSFHGISHIAQAINSCKDLEELVQQGEIYDRYFIRKFRKNRQDTPPSSNDDYISKSTLHLKREEIERVPRTHRAAKSSAMVRDGYKCVVTRHVDYHAFEKGLAGIFEDSPTLIASRSCYIFPESFGAEESAYTWEILDAFGYPHIREQLNGVRVHSLKNVFTLEPTLHRHFDTLDMWFEPEEKGNPSRYRVCTTFPPFLRGYAPADRIVEFVTSDPELDLLDFDYLQLHGVASKVAHESGLQKYLDQMDHERDRFDYDVCTEEFAGALAARLNDII